MINNLNNFVNRYLLILILITLFNIYIIDIRIINSTKVYYFIYKLKTV